MKRDSTDVYSPEERENMLRAMRLTSDAFYFRAVRIKNHAFIEFAGLMNEYIKMCEQSQLKGVDFTQTNTHTGQSLVAYPYNVDYMAEKLDCILGPVLAEQVITAAKKKAGVA